MTLKVPALHNIARLYQSTPEKVKQGIIRLHDARPPFSYEKLYEVVQGSLLVKDSFSNCRALVEGWSPSIRKDSYLRALGPTEKFFERFERSYEVEVVPRLYSIGRGLQAPFSPRILCGTCAGPVVPWLLFWKNNPLTEEQTALFHSLACDAFSSDPDLENARLILVDTSVKALAGTDLPRIVASDELPLVSRDRLRTMLDTFVAGYMLAQEELRGRPDAQVSKREYERRSVDPGAGQWSLFGE